MNLKKHWRTMAALMLVAAIGSCMLISADRLNRWESQQVSRYNIGLAAFKEGKVDEAMLAFDESLDAYAAMEKREGWQDRLYPARSSELAALAQSKKAILYLLKQKPELAVKAFKESISTNPGVVDPQLAARLMAGETLTSDDISRLADQSLVVKHNLELLYKKNPSMQQGEGKGKGKGKGKPKPGDKEGKDGDQPAPGSKPGPGSGQSNPNAI